MILRLLIFVSSILYSNLSISDELNSAFGYTFGQKIPSLNESNCGVARDFILCDIHPPKPYYIFDKYEADLTRTNKLLREITATARNLITSNNECIKHSESLQAILRDKYSIAFSPTMTSGAMLKYWDANTKDLEVRIICADNAKGSGNNKNILQLIYEYIPLNKTNKNTEGL